MVEFYEKENTTIYWGDVLEVLQEHVPDGSVDLTFIDPPYNIGKDFSGLLDKWDSEADYLEWCYQWLDLCLQKMKPNATLYLMASTQMMPYLDLYLRDKLHVLSRIIWHYDSSGVQAKKHFGSLYEPILHCVKNQSDYTFNSDAILVEAKTGAKRKLIDYRKPTPQPYNTTKVPGNAWYFPRVRYRMSEYENHPSQKPEILMERIIKASSHVGDVVLDPFAGSFTTAAVAQRLGRKSISIERQKEYIKIGLRRLSIQDIFNGESLEPLNKPFKPQKKHAQLPLFKDE